jgi:subtilisin family serine protease
MKTRIIPIAACLLAALSLSFAASPRIVAGTSVRAVDPCAPLIAPALRGAKGQVEIVVKLDDAPLALAHAPNAKISKSWMSKAAQQAQLAKIQSKHDALSAKAVSLGGVELARMNKALNAVVFRIDASQLAALANHPGVTSIRPVNNYHLDLSETVPYIGASAVQAAGVDGTGVNVAVIDTGVDYTHKNLGGPGTIAAYTAAFGTNTDDPANTKLDGLFPTAKVVGGYDFVGEVWPDGDLAPDPDPIDFNGHGTHVADIIAGKSLDGRHKGVAPGASIYAIRACSSVSPACSGVALLQAMDFALDPNRDGDISDAVDVVNMSLGSAYGQKEDDLSEASANAVRLGVIVVAAAGNDGDKPYVVSSPGSTPEVIAVAETQVPSAKGYPLIINSPSNIAGAYRKTETVGWAPIGAGFTGDVVWVGRGCDGDTYLGNPSGKVALIDRGACAVSLKVDRAAKAGAIGVLLAMADDSDPISFSYGGGDTFVPTLIIPRAVGDLIKANLGAPVNVTVSPSNAVPLLMSMVGSSARGPSVSYNAIKPDIGAPGASVSAEVGTGDGETAFGGTSGATPMISGSAALLHQAFPNRSPFEIKSLLMNNAETGIEINPALQPGVLAPITRIGGGEVRVNRAYKSTTAAWDKNDLTGSLSFGYQPLSSDANLVHTVVVRNYGNTKRTYKISSQFRYADDAASGAVTVQVPSTISVPANGSAQFDVHLIIDARALPTWNINGGSLGGSGPLLQGIEFDGYIHIADATDDVHLAWQVLPHKAAAITSQFKPSKMGGTLTLDNRNGATDGGIEVFSLTGQSSAIKKKFLPQPGDAFAVIDLQSVGVRLIDLGGEPGIQFAINTRGDRAHPNYPALFDVAIDSDGDGVIDHEVFNQEIGGFAATGQNGVFTFDDTDTNAVPEPVFYTDADLESANVILTAPLSLLGVAPGRQFTFSVYAVDDYFTGLVTDAIENMSYTLDTPAFSIDNGSSFILPTGTKGSVSVHAASGGATASPSQTGLLLLYRDSKPKAEADVIKLK